MSEPRIWRGWPAELADWITARRNLLEWHVQNWIPLRRSRRELAAELSAQWCERRFPPA